MKISQSKTFFRKLKAFLWRVLPVRQRYFLTRRGRLRARYVATAAVFVMMGGGVIFAQAVPSFKVSQQDYAFAFPPARAGEAENIMQAAQQRLARYLPQRDFEADHALTDDVISAVEDLPPDAIVQRKPDYPREQILKIGKGDTLAGVLQKAGIGVSEAYNIVSAMSAYYDPRKIRPGQEIFVKIDRAEGEAEAYQLTEMKIDIDAIKSVDLRRAHNGVFNVSMEEKELVSKVYAGRADIELSLYGSAQKVGIPASVIAQAMHIYSWDIDFQRDIRRGDALEVMYEQMETPEGIYVKSGHIVYARLHVNGEDIPVYRFEKEDGDADYFTADGKSIRKTLMQTPVDGARLSSGFGMRRHPVLGYNKMHKGVDFAAPRGTPVFAAGNGTVEKAGPFSSYGNYVRIRHNSELKTAYAHLQGFAKGIHAGKRVKQGQVIGYIGTTGRSTGPHLHYEVLKNGRQVNPKTVKKAQGESLKGAQLATFKKRVEKLDRQYATLTKRTTFAARETRVSKTLMR